MGQKKDVSDATRNAILHFLLESMVDGSIPRGKFKAAAELFKVGRLSVYRIWSTAKRQRIQHEVMNVQRSGQKRIRKKKHIMDFAIIEQIPVQDRGTIRRMHESLGGGISRATVGRWAKLLLRHHSNAMKPLLTAHHMYSRLQFSLKALHYDACRDILKFKSMENTIHIDEKWFYLTRKSCSYYLTPMEENPLRAGASKQFIPKVMFLCAVSRPLFDEDGRIIFDGKIGIWPLVEDVAAQRNSIRRPRGTIEKRPIQKITRQVIRDYMIKEIIPAIKQKWPTQLSKDILIQQDNARTHITRRDAEFDAVATSDGFNIKLVNQPAKSPDLNANDLGFFCAIQALQQRKNCKNAEDLIAAVSNSFIQLDAMTLNKLFLSLQQVMMEIMKAKGTNNFKQPHMNKDGLIRLGILPTNIEVPKFLVQDCLDYLVGEEKSEGLEDLMEALGMHQIHAGEGVPDLNA